MRSPRSSGAGQFAVDRYSIASVGAARGRYVALSLKEKSGFDTGAVPAVFYKRPAKKSRGVRATARRRGVAASTTYNDTRDKAAARLQSARTEDANLNGFVDGVVARFSETVKADPAAIAVAGATVTAVAKRGRDDFTASLAEGPLRSAARPEVSFGNARKVVRDLAGNVAPRTSVQATDGAAPVIVAARTLDRGGIGGRLDTLSLTWSEPVAHGPDSDGTYPFGVTGYSIASASGTSGAQLDLALTEGDVPDSGVRPPVGYTRGAGARVLDANGNEAASHVFAAASDAIAPRLVGSRTIDIDSDGKLDGVRFTFTELDHLPAASVLERMRVLRDRSQRSHRAGGLGNLGGGHRARRGAQRRPEAEYLLLPGNGRRRARPVRQRRSRGRPDGRRRRASCGARRVHGRQRLRRPHRSGARDVLRVAQLPRRRRGSDLLHRERLHRAERERRGRRHAHAEPRPQGRAPTRAPRPAVGYNGQGGVRLYDANGVEHANRSWPSLTRDAVAPQFVDARTADLNADTGNEIGKLDAVELVYSEEITGTPDVTDFQVHGPHHRASRSIPTA